MKNIAIFVIIIASAFFSILMFKISILTAKSSFNVYSQPILLTSFFLVIIVVYFIYCIISDNLTHKENLEEAFKFDGLTKLPNENYFKTLVENKIQKHLKEKETESLYLMNIGFNRFSELKDGLTNDFINNLIISKTNDLIEILSEEDDELSRSGEGSFYLITTRDKTSLLPFLKEIKDCLNGFYSDEKTTEEVFTEINIGVAEFTREKNQDFNSLLKEATTAYRFLNDKKEFYKVFNKSLEESSQQNLELEILLRDAVFNEEIMVNFQPKIGRDGKIKSAEALARWYSKEKEQFVRPDIFIEMAENMGLIEEVGKHIMELSIKELKKWHKKGYTDMKIAVNVSPKQFNRELPIYIKELLKKYHLDPKYLEVEVTEGALVTDKNAGMDLLNKIKNTGVRIAIDDFGTGYSSLSYLTDFPLDVVKIDKSFVDKILSKESDVKNKGEAIISTVINLSHKIGCDVVAEGVEEQEQLDFLNGENCDLIQGYFYSKPLNKKEFGLFLEENY